jgi:hypothetical protein
MGVKILKTAKLWSKSIILKFYLANFYHILDPNGSLFSNESFFRKFGSRSSLTRTSHWLKRPKARARPNTIFPRSTQHYFKAVFTLTRRLRDPSEAFSFLKKKGKVIGRDWTQKRLHGYSARKAITLIVKVANSRHLPIGPTIPEIQMWLPLWLACMVIVLNA